MSLFHLKALLKKNLLIMKRTYIITIIEISSPIIVMILFWRLNSLFKTEHLKIADDEDYIDSNSTSIKNKGFGSYYESYFLLFNIFFICQYNPIIALVGNDFPKEIFEDYTKKLRNSFLILIYDIKIKSYDSLESLNSYISSDEYKKDSEHPGICFGLSYDKSEIKYKYKFKIHFFASPYSKYTPSIPSTTVDNLDPFLTQPDFGSYSKYIKQGFLIVQKLIYDYVLKKETNNSDAEINIDVYAQKYGKYLYNTFYSFLSMLLGFFVLIAYTLPLSIYINKLVKEKESKAKEGMKIMGLNELNYFLSYFIIYFILNLVYSICNTFIIREVLTYIEGVYIFFFFLLYGLMIYSLIFFFQSFLEKSRIAIIVSLLIYCLMFFLGLPIYSNAVSRFIKILFSLLFPPITMQLGINTICHFQINFNKFNGRVFMRYNKFCFFDMYMILLSNFILYMFLGFYIQNIISHEYGIKKPWYFLFTKEFWLCGKKKSKNKKFTNQIDLDNNLNFLENNNNPATYRSSDSKTNINDETKRGNNNVISSYEYFETEKKYNVFNQKSDIFQIKDIHKIFEDGKNALNGVTFNLYKNEIFALLGHNGAGKTTLFNILTGLYSSSSGSAFYNSYNILSSEGAEHFRKVLGICPQHDVLFNDLTVEEHLVMFCVFKSVKSSLISQEVLKAIKDFGLEEKRNTKVENLSGGQKRKLSIAIALVGGSSVIFLDEPTSGMDITSRRNLWNILKKSINGKIIILTTHYMEEASELGNRIGILSEGNMKCIGSPLFLIEKFGKAINLNITKNPDADNEEIIKFINENICNDINIENEVFKEEILLKIPKIFNQSNNFIWSDFFKNLDENCERLKIKNYSISMPTLEDVFINISKLIKQNKIKNELKDEIIDITNKINENNKILYDESNYHTKYNSFSKVLRDAKISFKKRIFQIYRDKKTFLLEILCPIILTLIGCVVGSIEFLEKNRTFPLLINQITNDTQLIFYSYVGYNIENTFKELFIEYSSEDISKIKYEEIEISSEIFNSYPDLILNDLYNIKKTKKEKNFVHYIISKIDTIDHKYEFSMFVDIISRQSAPIYANFLYKNFIRYATKNKELDVEIINEPLPYTKKEIKDKQRRNEAMILFFISLSFTLIPSNFITIIIKERENNSKHLQIISGISLFSYWFNNYLFELVKYYVIGGICILLLYCFKFYQDYLYILYLEYGPAMVSFTYFFSFIFKSEEKGQTVVLLINLIIGALGGSAVIIMRLREELVKYSQDIIYIFRIIPSFCFCYGYNQLIRRNELFQVDLKVKKIPLTTKNNPSDILKLKYMGSDCIYLAVESLVYLLILIILENSKIIFRSCLNIKKKKSIKEIVANNNAIKISIPSNVNDTFVKNEIIKAKNPNEQKKYAIKVQSLVKTFYGGPFGFKILNCSKPINAVNNISFCLDYGEIFGFLGVNGAGKTTTFKCLSNELFPTSGTIYIDEYEITKNFNKIRNLIGYCPQFDAIFEYLTVYENLEFYGLIKGARKNKIKLIINALIEEINLLPFKNTVSGKLSGGNKRKLSVAIALICNPPIILLDEPSTGMDPEARRCMWGVINRVSLNQKKSTIIMTTHSMEEAETLCKRIGILVVGQFKCLSTIDNIKEKYGYGYEINLQINTPKINDLYQLYNINEEDKRRRISLDSLVQYLILYGLEKYARQIKSNYFGEKILEEIELKGYITFDKILLWIYFLKNALDMIKIIFDYFKEIYCIDCGENNFIFKIKRNKAEGEKSIGFLFGLIEDNKIKYNIGQYFLQLSSLEKIFNEFANEKNKFKDNQNKFKVEIQITEELLSSLK